MDDGRKLEKIMVRYFPPGIILEFKDEEGYIDNKSIDLLNLSENSDIAYLVQQIKMLKIIRKIVFIIIMVILN